MIIPETNGLARKRKVWGAHRGSVTRIIYIAQVEELLESTTYQDSDSTRHESGIKSWLRWLMRKSSAAYLIRVKYTQSHCPEREIPQTYRREVWQRQSSQQTLCAWMALIGSVSLMQELPEAAGDTATIPEECHLEMKRKDVVRRYPGRWTTCGLVNQQWKFQLSPPTSTCVEIWSPPRVKRRTEPTLDEPLIPSHYWVLSTRSNPVTVYDEGHPRGFWRRGKIVSVMRVQSKTGCTTVQ